MVFKRWKKTSVLNINYEPLVLIFGRVTAQSKFQKMKRRSNNWIWAIVAVILGVLIWLFVRFKGSLMALFPFQKLANVPGNDPVTGYSGQEGANSFSISGTVSYSYLVSIPKDYNYQITANFNLNEFVKSATATKHGIKLEPDLVQCNNIVELCYQLLQPIRDIYGKPMIVSSGFRTSELNDLVGGSKTSDHMTGKAVDISVNDPQNLYELVKRSGLSYDQLILYPTFVHMSFRSVVENRNMYWVEK